MVKSRWPPYCIAYNTATNQPTQKKQHSKKPADTKEANNILCTSSALCIATPGWRRIHRLRSLQRLRRWPNPSCSETSSTRWPWGPCRPGPLRRRKGTSSRTWRSPGWGRRRRGTLPRPWYRTPSQSLPMSHYKYWSCQKIVIGLCGPLASSMRQFGYPIKNIN